MSLLLTMGSLVLPFLLNSLTTIYLATLSGLGLATGFHLVKKYIKSRELKKLLADNTNNILAGEEMV